MTSTEKSALLFTAKLIVWLSITFAVMFYLPQHAHHVLLLIALVLSFTGAGALLEYRRQALWKRTNARVDSIREDEQDVAMGKTSCLTYYFPKIEYAYVIDGTAYKGTRVSYEKENVWINEADDWGVPIPEQRWWWRSIQAGDEIPAYVNPRKPHEAVLINRLSKHRRSHHLALLVSGILLALIWLLLFAYNLSLPS